VVEGLALAKSCQSFCQRGMATFTRSTGGKCVAVVWAQELVVCACAEGGGGAVGARYARQSAACKEGR